LQVEQWHLVQFRLLLMPYGYETLNLHSVDNPRRTNNVQQE
jgi:hypothetical protein